MDKSRIAMVTMGKLHSKRCTNKMFRKIGKKTLWEHHLSILSEVDFVESKYVFARDQELIERVPSGFEIVPRDTRSTTATSFYTLWCDFIRRAVCKNYDFVIWVNACCPFLKPETLYEASLICSKDKITIPVTEGEFICWHNDCHYGKKKLNTQDNPCASFLSHAFWIRTPQQLLDTQKDEEYSNQHEKAKQFCIKSKIEAFDIDTEEDLLIANSIYNFIYT